MLSGEIRKKFLEFFKGKKHEIVPSDSLVPKKDPTLLFTSAGMNQFKEQFLGHNITFRRAASSQKCLRTADLEKVGKTPSHHTFFEMLGNFSFGDYFKKEAIGWGWEFMTKTLGIKEEKLWVSVYEDDEESYKIWRDVIKVPAKKIVKLGAKENFWPSNAPKDGPNGPCGPCSEIFYDWGKGAGCGKKNCDPSCDCGRFVEVWNLVFTQFERKPDGKLDPLPSKNIDTGMGLERITAVMQGVKTNFETDLFAPIIAELKAYSLKLSRQRRDPEEFHLGGLHSGKTASLNVIADHIRAVSFAICDGVAPSNEERGYVIRKLIRRAYMRGQSAEGQDRVGRGSGEPFLYNIVPKIAEITKDAYPELIEKREEISLIVKEEEERFSHTLELAAPILEENLKKAKKMLSGEAIFKLVDTYGLPLEVIESRAEKKKIMLDIENFEKLMADRRELSRKKSKIEEDIFALNLFAKAPKVARSDKMPLEAKVAFMVKGKQVAKEAREGDVVEVLTDPESALFYTESGGQLGDRGTIESDGCKMQILNTVKTDNKVVHIAKVIKGTLAEGEGVRINLDTERKKRIARNHTATHLMHSALREVLGGHVHQAGSLVAEDRLRFDFTHMKKLRDQEIEKVETLVNDYIKKGITIEKEEKTLEAAKEEGAIALFGEKYADRVNVISCGDFSKEVCGGTHVDNTKDIGLFKIVRESSVASGVRRIEAVTGDSAREWLAESEKRKAEGEKLLEEKEKAKRLAKEKLREAERSIESIVAKAKDIKGVKVIIEEVKNADMGILRKLTDRIREKEKSVFIMLAGENNERANLVLALGDNLVSAGANASDIIKSAAKMLDGSGGGRADFAQAGGKDPSKFGEVFQFAEKTAADIIKGVSR